MWRGLFVIASLGVAQVLAADSYSCLTYGPISIAGTLVRQTYAGPPDYESVTKGDEPRVIWVLQLDRRVCVDGNARFPREPTQIEMEVALAPADYPKYHHLLGQKIIVTGELVHGGANYQKRLVLEASDLQQTSVVP